MFVNDILWIYFVTLILTARGSDTTTSTSIYPSHSDSSSTKIYEEETVLEPSFSSINSQDLMDLSTSKFAALISISPTSTRDLTSLSQVTNTPVYFLKSDSVSSNTDSENAKGDFAISTDLSFSTDMDLTSGENNGHTFMSTPVLFGTENAEVGLSKNIVKTKELLSEMSVKNENLSKYSKELDIDTWSTQQQIFGISSISLLSSLYDPVQDEASAGLSRIIAYVGDTGAFSFSSTSLVSHLNSLTEETTSLTEMTGVRVPLLTETHGVISETAQSMYDFTNLSVDSLRFGSSQSELLSINEISDVTYSITLTSSNASASVMSSVTLTQQSDDIEGTHVTNNVINTTNAVSPSANSQVIDELNSATSITYTIKETDTQSSIFVTNERISVSFSQLISGEVLSASISQHDREINSSPTLLNISEFTPPKSEATSFFSVSEERVALDSSFLTHMVTYEDSLITSPLEVESSSFQYTKPVTFSSITETFSTTFIDSEINKLVTVIASDELFPATSLFSEIYTSVFLDSLMYTTESSASGIVTSVLTASISLAPMSLESSLSTSMQVKNTDTPMISTSQLHETVISSAESFTSTSSSSDIFVSSDQTIYIHNTVSGSELVSLFPSNRETTKSMVLATSSPSSVAEQTNSPDTAISSFQIFNSKSLSDSLHVSLYISSTNSFSTEMSATDLSSYQKFSSIPERITSFISNFISTGQTASLHGVSSILDDYVPYSITTTYDVATSEINEQSVTASTAIPFSSHFQGTSASLSDYTKAFSSLIQTAAFVTSIVKPSSSAFYKSSVFSTFNLSDENHTLSVPYYTTVLSSFLTPSTTEALSTDIIGHFSTSSSFIIHLTALSSPVISESSTDISEYITVDNINFTVSSSRDLSSFMQEVKTGTGSQHLFSVSSVTEHQQNLSTDISFSDFYSDRSNVSTTTVFPNNSVYTADTTTVNSFSTSFSLIGQSNLSVISSTSTKYYMSTVAISDQIESEESNELDSPAQTQIISQVIDTSVSQMILLTSFHSDAISSVFSTEPISHASLTDFISVFPLTDSYLSNSIFPFSTSLTESYILTYSILFPDSNFETPSSSFTHSFISKSLPEETKSILQDSTNLSTSFMSLPTTKFTLYPIASLFSVSHSDSFLYGSNHLPSSFVSLKPLSSDIIFSTGNVLSKHSTKQLSQSVMTSLSTTSTLSARDPLMSSVEKTSISELGSFTPIPSLSADSEYLVTTDSYISSLTEHSSFTTHSSQLYFTSVAITPDSQIRSSSNFITVSFSSLMDDNSILPSTLPSSYFLPTTVSLKVSTSVQSDSDLMSFITSSRQITPQTTSEMPNPTTSPAVNITDSRENFWVKTVLMARRSTNISGSTFRADIETRMAEAYNEAFKRERLIEQGLYDALRRKRYSYNGEAAVHIHDVTRVGDTTSVNVVYAVEKAGTTLTADEAAASLNVLDAQELAIILRQVVQTVAEPYQSSSKPSDSENGGIPLWLIATIAGSVAGLIILTWVSVCIYMKCFREKKEMEKHSEPKLTAIQQNDDMNDTRSRSAENGTAGPSVKYDMSRQTSKTSLKKFTTYHVQQTDEEALIDNSSQNKLDDPAPKNNRTTQPSSPEKPYFADLKSPKRRSDFGSNGSLSNKPELDPPTSYRKASKANSVGVHTEGHTNIAYSEDFETRPKPHDHKYKVLQSSFSDQDNEELRQRSRRERQANKARIKLKKRKHRPSVIDSTSGIPYSTIEMQSTRLPEVKVESGSVVKDSTDNNNVGFTDRRPSTGDLTGDESLEEARSRMHRLLDDAFSLISPRASFAENDSKAHDHPFTVQYESAKMSGSNTFGMPETDLGRNIQDDSMYANPAYDSQSSFPLETWSPYRASDLVAMISMPSKQEQTRLGQKPKNSTRSLSSVSNRRPAANFDFSESKSASTLKDEKYTTSPAKPIVIRSKDLVDDGPTSGTRNSSGRTNSGRASSNRTSNGSTNIGRSNTGRTNSGRSQNGRTTVMVNPLPKENQSEQYDMTLIKNARNAFPKKMKTTDVDKTDFEQRDTGKRSEVDPNSDQFIKSLRDELSELRDMYVSKPNEQRNNKKHVSSLRTDV